LNKINPNVENTFIIYRHRNIIDKFINRQPITEYFQILPEKLDKTRGDYFYLPEPKFE